MRLYRGDRGWGAWAQIMTSVFMLVLGVISQRSIVTPGQYIVRAKPHPVTRLYQFPNGGRLLFPNYRLVALYGVPNTPVLGALGAQTETDTIARVKALASSYQSLINAHVLPTLEIITTVASAYPESEGSYSYPIDHQEILQWVSDARKSGVYVVLDLQPGRESFPTQALRLTDILAKPNVGLALDPEWRLQPSQLPLQQIGSVDISEVNQTISWLTALTKEYKLPQKLFLLHQFRLSMITNRSQLDTTHPELAYAIQMDGQGSQAEKLNTWSSITADAPANVHFGWKNFYLKDSPVRSTAETIQVAPEPWYISYQ